MFDKDKCELCGKPKTDKVAEMGEEKFEKLSEYAQEIGMAFRYTYNCHCPTYRLWDIIAKRQNVNYENYY